MRALVVTVLVFLPVSSTLADNTSLEQKIIGCSNVKDDIARLKCYDSTLKSNTDKQNSNQDIVRQEWHGNGLLTTRPFHMADSWEFQFNTQGGFFSAMLYHKGETAGEAMPSIIANQTGKGDGSSYIDAAGDYYIVVNALGPWTAKAVSVSK